jgi:hypothetical protein
LTYTLTGAAWCARRLPGSAIRCLSAARWRLCAQLMELGDDFRHLGICDLVLRRHRLVWHSHQVARVLRDAAAAPDNVREHALPLLGTTGGLHGSPAVARYTARPAGLFPAPVPMCATARMKTRHISLICCTPDRLKARPVTKVPLEPVCRRPSFWLSCALCPLGALTLDLAARA